MHINFHSFSNQAISSLKENILPTLTAQQKKILIIASIALGFLAALYLAGRCCSQDEISDGEEKKTYPDKALEKSDLEHNSQKLPDGTIGEGEFKGGMLHGKGKKTYPDGTVLEGHFDYNDLDGQGKKTYPYGTIEEGTFLNDALEAKISLLEGTRTHPDGTTEEGKWYKTGPLFAGKKTHLDGTVEEGKWYKAGSLFAGKKTLSDGTVQEGIFEHGQCIQPKSHSNPHKGIIINQDGSVAEGEFKDEKLHGQGKITFFNGNVYEGIFQDGKLNGQGKKTFRSGRVESGEYKDGKLNGQGERTYLTGTTEAGEYKDGQLNGQGNRTYVKERNGSGRQITQVREGEFKNGKLNGRGIKTHADGQVEEGDFINDVLNGQGKITFANGRVWEGKFKGERELVDPRLKKVCPKWVVLFAEGIRAEGKRTLPDGTIEEGIWYGPQHNFDSDWSIYNDDTDIYEGKKTFSNGKVEEGIFKNGRLVQPKLIKTNKDAIDCDNNAKNVVVEGECLDGRLFGNGKATFGNGDIWKGEWKYGHFHQGKRVLHDGTVEEGEFKENELNGKGKRIYSHGYVEEGLFKDGNFIGHAPQSPPLKKAEG